MIPVTSCWVTVRRYSIFFESTRPSPLSTSSVRDLHVFCMLSNKEIHSFSHLSFVFAWLSCFLIPLPSSLLSSLPYYYRCLLRPDWCWLKCTRWPLRLTLFFPLPNLCLPPHPLAVSLSHHFPSFLRLSFLAVSWGAEANEGWLRLLWLLQGHWLHGWLQWRLWTAVSPAACAPWRWPQFQQRAHVLRVRTTNSKHLKGVCGLATKLPREISFVSDI